MKPTQHKIITTAIELFNQDGTGNVRVQDIAAAAEISPGNLTYHYKTKNDLMLGVIEYVQQSLSETSKGYDLMGDAMIWISIIRNYLDFQTRFRFFYRDTLVIIKLYPEARSFYRSHLQKIIHYNKNAVFLAVGRGFMINEPHDGHYEVFAKNLWSVLNSWLTEREVLGESQLDYKKGVTALLEMHYPYFTKKGIEFYNNAKKHLPEWMEGELGIKM